MMPVPIMNFRPPAYRPAYRPRRAPSPASMMLSNGPSMEGNPSHQRPGLGAFSAKALPLSILMVSGGAAGFYAASLLPEPATTILRAVGIGAIGYGIYNAFSGPEAVQSSAEGFQGGAAPIMSPEAFALVTGTFLTPSSGSKLPNSGSFDMKIVWYNRSDEDANFTYDIFANVLVPGPDPLAKAQSIYTGVEVLAKNSSSGPIPLNLPIIQPPANRRQSYANSFAMELTLRKYDPEKNAVAVTAPWRLTFPWDSSIGPDYGAAMQAMT